MTDVVVVNGAHVDSVDADGKTPLCYARSAEVARVLLKYKAFINYVDNFGRTPLALAVQDKRNDIVPCLLAGGADVEIQDNISGSTALRLACDTGNEHAARLLLDHKASIDHAEVQDAYLVVRYLADKRVI